MNNPLIITDCITNSMSLRTYSDSFYISPKFYFILTKELQNSSYDTIYINSYIKF